MKQHPKRYDMEDRTNYYEKDNYSFLLLIIQAHIYIEGLRPIDSRCQFIVIKPKK